jgi:hypothetical protein
MMDTIPSSRLEDVVDEETKAAILEAFRQGDIEHAFWAEHYQELLKQYPEQFVAVDKDRGTVVAADPHLDPLLEMLQAQGIARDRVWVRFLRVYPGYLIL